MSPRSHQVTAASAEKADRKQFSVDNLPCLLEILDTGQTRPVRLYL